jgi:uncharacterized protein
MKPGGSPLPLSFQGLVDFIAEHYHSAMEIGIGWYPDVALALMARGIRVRATDIDPRPLGNLDSVQDDITRPCLRHYQGFDLYYAVRPPLELVPYLKRLADHQGVDLVIKPLQAEFPGGRLVQKGKSFFFFWNCSDGGWKR